MMIFLRGEELTKREKKRNKAHCVRYECSRMILIYGGVQSRAYLFIYHMLHLPRLHERGNYNICIVCALSVNQ